MKILSQNKHNLMKSNGLYIFFNSFGDPSSLWKYEQLKKNSILFII